MGYYSNWVRRYPTVKDLVKTENNNLSPPPHSRGMDAWGGGGGGGGIYLSVRTEGGRLNGIVSLVTTTTAVLSRL
jgi:hypothetical protein